MDQRARNGGFVSQHREFDLALNSHLPRTAAPRDAGAKFVIDVEGVLLAGYVDGSGRIGQGVSHRDECLRGAKVTQVVERNRPEIRTCLTQKIDRYEAA